MKKDKFQIQQMVLGKTPTSLKGLDEITFDGLPKGRPTLVCGITGCGKTLLAMEFLVRGATQFNDPGVFMSFEETEKDQHITNLTSLGFDLNDLVERKIFYKPGAIDLYPRPKLAIGKQINAIQMVIKKQPLSLNRVVGNMSNTGHVLVGLNLRKVNRNEVPLSI